MSIGTAEPAAHFPAEWPTVLSAYYCPYCSAIDATINATLEATIFAAFLEAFKPTLLYSLHAAFRSTDFSSYRPAK